MLRLFKSYPLFFILLFSLLFRMIAAFMNVGFVAIDDYVYMLKFAFPAQSTPSFEKIIESSWVLPAIPMLGLASLSAIPMKLGLLDPLKQIQFIYALMGVFSLISVWAAYRIFSEAQRDKEAIIAALLVGLHGLMPFFSTRVLFETFTMTPLMLSLYFFVRFQRQQLRKHLVFSLLFLALASLLRFQSGVCFLAMCLLIFSKNKHRQDRIYFIIVSILAFILSGLSDFLIGRSFHQSLLDYINYNINHSSDYGTSGPFNFFLFFIAVSLPPFLFTRFRGLHWRASYSGLSAAVAFFLVFLISHSLIPHKEDRFMIPILPVFFVCITPLVHYVFNQNIKWRRRYFVGLNAIILFLATGFTAQWNTIGTARFLHQNTSFDALYNYRDSLVFMPTAYMNRPNLEMLEMKEDILPELNCNMLFAVRQDKLVEWKKANFGLKKVALSQPGPLEWLVVQLNPKNNGRRASIHLFQSNSCP